MNDLRRTIRVLVVDDERLARDEMTFLLGKLDYVDVVAEATDGEQALALIREHSPDVVLLDVEMPELDGFGVIERMVEEEHVPQVVFVTAYDEYAVQAFEVQALDYILKPVDERRLEEALSRVRSPGEETREQLAALVGIASGQRGALPPRLAVRKGDRYILVNPSDITHCYILDGVVFVVAGQTKGMTQHRTLEELEKDLDGTVFWRVHRGYIANVNHVAEVIPWQNGTYRLRLDDAEGTLVPLSRAQARRIRRILKW